MIPLELKLAALAAAVAAALFGAYRLERHFEAAGAQGCELKTAQAVVVAQQAVSASAAVQAQAQQEAISHAHDQTMQVAAAAGRALDAAVQLRQRAAVVAGSCAASAPALAGSAPAYAAGDLLADVLGRAADAAQQLAAYADAARVAGNACQQSYGALMK